MQGGDAKRIKRIHVFNKDTNAARLGVDAKGGFEQVIALFGHFDIEAGIAVSKNRVVDKAVDRGLVGIGQGLAGFVAETGFLVDLQVLLDFLPFVGVREFRMLGPALLEILANAFGQLFQKVIRRGDLVDVQNVLFKERLQHVEGRLQAGMQW